MDFLPLEFVDWAARSAFRYYQDHPLSFHAYVLYTGAIALLHWRSHRRLGGRLSRIEGALFPNRSPMNVTPVAIPESNYRKGRLWYKPQRIVIHWMAGTLRSTDATFKNPKRRASAHFGVEDGEVHQYVKVEDTAYHCGNWLMNLKSVGIEHSAEPGRDASEATYETSARLMAEIARKCGIELSEKTVRPHKEFMATQCPGTLDIPRLIRRANEILNPPQGIDRPLTPAVPGEPASAKVPVEGEFSKPLQLRVTALRGVNVRRGPHTKSERVTALLAGATAFALGYLHSDVIDAGLPSENDKWYRLASNEWAWAGAFDVPHPDPNY